MTLILATGTAQAKATQGLGQQCEDAIRAAARSNGNPVELMAAIGLVESGRADATTGAVKPWPWTINAEGKGLFFKTKSEAIAAVRQLQADGVRSIDVGCMQVNLMHHPDAFATLDEAFDPRRNALYAGRFLGQLFRQSRDWLTAAGLYHSATPALATDYLKQVAAVLRIGKGGRAFPGHFPQPEMAARNVAPVIGRDGTIVPSVRLTSSGLVTGRASPGKARVQFSGWSNPPDRRHPRGS